MPEKLVQRRLNELEILFTDKYYGFSQHILETAKDPVLYIDNEKIHHTEIRKALARLKKNDVAYINIKTIPQDIGLYGQNGRNGIVIIWTNQELKRASS